MIIVADSGSTSIDWRMIEEDGTVFFYKTEGVNPVFQGREVLESKFSEVAGNLSSSSSQVRKIYFYGAGILSDETEKRVMEALFRTFGCEDIVAKSDLLGAARALFGRSEGIVAILGTGSNSALYDGANIVRNIKSGGFILGDEGSGAALGRNLLSDYIKELLPGDLRNALDKRYSLDYVAIVEKVYRGEMPSKFLASFSFFLKENEKHPYIQRFLEDNFKSFFERNILSYRRNVQIGFAGSVASAFEEIIRKAAAQSGLVAGKFLQNVADGLVKYHLSELKKIKND